MDMALQLHILIVASISGTCLMLAIMSRLIDYQSELRKKILISIEAVTSLLLLADGLEKIFDGKSSIYAFWGVRICNFLVFALIYVELAAFYKYINTFIESRVNTEIGLEKIVNTLACIGIGLIVVSQFTGIYYSFDSNNMYSRGPLFSVSYAVPLAIIIIMLVDVLKHKAEYTRHIYIAALVYLVLPLGCSILQVLIDNASIFNISVGIAMLTLFALSLVDQNEYLSKVAITDKKTGLFNSDGFMQLLDTKIQAKEITKYDVIFIDIVRMGMINRKYGNVIGDYVIMNYSHQIRDYLRDDEQIGRLGGNYFIILANRDNTENILKFISGVDVPINKPDGTEIVTVAAVAGVYEVIDEVVTVNQLMTNVSLALNIAKNIKKKPYVYMTQELLQEMTEQKNLLEIIPKCMEKKEFRAYYQPKVKASSGRLSGAEALSRWVHDGEVVMPYRFIPVLEGNDAICKFDFYMLNLVCSDIKEWISKGYNPPPVSINFSRKNLGNPILAEEIYNVVKSYDIPLNLIQIEITETIDEYPLEYLKGVVEALQRYGLSAAIDDFGTGSSSIKILKEVPFDILKIDKSFIDSISERDKHILAHIVGIANETGTQIITEGVETKEQVEVLQELGCDEIQGFFFDKPLEREVFEKRIENPTYSIA